MNKTARLYGFGKRGKVWFRHLVDEGYTVEIVEPKFQLSAKKTNVELIVIASTPEAHKDNMFDDGYKADILIVEKPLVSSLSDLDILRARNNFWHPPICSAYCERFKYATQFIKNLNLTPDKLQIVFPTTWLDTGIHLLDLIQYFGYHEFACQKPKWVSSYGGNEQYDFTYAGSSGYAPKELILIAYQNGVQYTLNTTKNTVSISGRTYERIEFGPQNTIPLMMQNLTSLYEDLICGPTAWALELESE
jgi:hypothetical protein